MAELTLKRILLVEDEPSIQTVGRMTLELIGGFEVEVADCGQDALVKVRSFKPQLILLDVMMPDMDGPTTFVELQKMPDFCHIPVIFMTAKVQPREVAEYLALGALGVFPKPYDPATMPMMINDLWAKRNRELGLAALVS